MGESCRVVSRDDVVESRDADDFLAPDEDAAAIHTDAVQSGFVHIGLASGVAVAEIVDIGIGEDEVPVVLAVQRPDVNEGARDIEDDLASNQGLQCGGIRCGHGKVGRK